MARYFVVCILVFLTVGLIIVSCDGGAIEPVEPMEPTGEELGPEPETGHFLVHFIDVGQGDATLITASTGERMLVDGGRSKSRIRDRLNSLGVSDLDAIVATHADADHLAGLIEVLELFEIERFYYHQEAKDSATYRTFVRAARDEGAEIIDPRRGDRILLGDLTFDVLNPGRRLRGESNEDSIVLRLSCGTVDVLLMADAEVPSERDMVAAGVLGDVEVLKVGHHGSRTASSTGFLRATTPEHAVISAGGRNSYGHPHDEVVEAIESLGAEIISTDLDRNSDDTVEMESDCTSYSLSR